MAAIVMVELPMMPNLWSSPPPIAPLNITTMATPRLAALDIPSTEGPARGLRKTVCISSPATESPAPQAIAVSVCGRRVCITMLVHISYVSLPWSPLPKGLRMLNTAAVGMLTDPTVRLRTEKATMLSMSNIIIVVCRISVLFLFRRRGRPTDSVLCRAK